MEEQQEKIVGWPESLESTDYFKLEDERVKLVITNWRVVEIVKKFKEGESEKTVGEFRCDVLNVDKKPLDVAKQFTNTSKRFRKELDKAAKKAGVDLSEVGRYELLSFSVKKIGADMDTNYDVEDFSIITPISED